MATLPSAVEQEIWRSAVAEFEGGNHAQAYCHFEKLGSRAKILYNMAICKLLDAEPEAACDLFKSAIAADPFLCVAHFHVGYQLHIRGNYEEAIRYYGQAIHCLRGNNMIDYGQLGLQTIIYASEIYLNMAVSQLQNGDRGTAMRTLVNAHQSACLTEHEADEQLLMSGAENSVSLFQPPKNLIFKPKHTARSPSIGSLGSLSAAPGRTLLSVARGEVDKSLQFMAPVHQETVHEDIARTEGIRHRRGHSRSSSTVTFSTPSYDNHRQSSPSSPKFDNIVKLCISKQGGEEEIRLMALDNSCVSFGELQVKVKQKLKSAAIKIKYRDPEGDLIMICDDEDVDAALDASKMSESTYRLVLWCQVI